MIQTASFRIRIPGFLFISLIKRLIAAVAPLDLNLFGVNEFVALNPSVRLGKDSRLFPSNVFGGIRRNRRRRYLGRPSVVFHPST